MHHPTVFRGSGFQTFVALGLVFLLSLGPVTPRTHAAPQRERIETESDHKKDDPCSQLKELEDDGDGRLKNLISRCRAGGSSSGVVKGDFNGDGYADLAIGEPDATVGGHAGAGDVIVLLGSATGLVTSNRQLWYEGRTPGSPEAGDSFGFSLASGDFNGDGYSDLAIGIPNKNVSTPGLFGPTVHAQSGAVVVLYGSPNGLTTTDPSVPPARVFNLTMANLPPAPAFCSWQLDHAHLGLSLAWGDFNHDGRGDLAIGAPKLSPVSGLSLCSSFALGGVWEVLGTGSGAGGGLGLTGNQVWTQVNVPGLTDASPLELGFSLAAADFNNDGFDDLAIGAPIMQTPSGAFTGGVVILFGGLVSANPGSGFQKFTLDSVTAPGAGQDNAFFGISLAAGDFNGDGKHDLAIGAPGAHSGVSGTATGFVITMFGSQTVGLTTAGNQLINAATVGQTAHNNDQFGSVLAAGDFNGDGRSDLAIGIPFRDYNGLANAGEVDVIYGSPSGLSATTHAPLILHNLATPHAGDRFGASLTAWNFGRDELSFSNGLAFFRKTADLAVGIPYQAVNGVSGAGAINVFYGSVASNGLNVPNAVIFTADSIGIGGQAGAHFGASLY